MNCRKHKSKNGSISDTPSFASYRDEMESIEPFYSKSTETKSYPTANYKQKYPVDETFTTILGEKMSHFQLLSVADKHLCFKLSAAVQSSDSDLFLHILDNETRYLNDESYQVLIESVREVLSQSERHCIGKYWLENTPDCAVLKKENRPIEQYKRIQTEAADAENNRDSISRLVTEALGEIDDSIVSILLSDKRPDCIENRLQVSMEVENKLSMQKKLDSAIDLSRIDGEGLDSEKDVFVFEEYAAQEESHVESSEKKTESGISDHIVVDLCNIDFEHYSVKEEKTQDAQKSGNPGFVRNSKLNASEDIAQTNFIKTEAEAKNQSALRIKPAILQEQSRKIFDVSSSSYLPLSKGHSTPSLYWSTDKLLFKTQDSPPFHFLPRVTPASHPKEKQPKTNCDAKSEINGFFTIPHAADLTQAKEHSKLDFLEDMLLPGKQTTKNRKVYQAKKKSQKKPKNPGSLSDRLSLVTESEVIVELDVIAEPEIEPENDIIEPEIIILESDEVAVEQENIIEQISSPALISPIQNDQFAFPIEKIPENTPKPKECKTFNFKKGKNTKATDAVLPKPKKAAKTEKKMSFEIKLKKNVCVESETKHVAEVDFGSVESRHDMILKKEREIISKEASQLVTSNENESLSKEETQLASIEETAPLNSESQRHLQKHLLLCTPPAIPQSFSNQHSQHENFIQSSHMYPDMTHTPTITFGQFGYHLHGNMLYPMPIPHYYGYPNHGSYQTHALYENEVHDENCLDSLSETPLNSSIAFPTSSSTELHVDSPIKLSMESPLELPVASNIQIHPKDFFSLYHSTRTDAPDQDVAKEMIENSSVIPGRHVRSLKFPLQLP